MAKVILLLLAGLAVYLIVKNFRRRVDHGQRGSERRGEESMVRCAVCGLHHPRSESLLSAGKFYCSAEHERRSRHDG